MSKATTNITDQEYKKLMVKSITTIKNWVIFFGIITILNILLAAYLIDKHQL